MDRLWIVFFLMSVIIAWFASVKTPPFSSPDEGAHFLRAVEISHGKIINSKGSTGVEIKCDEYYTIAAKYAPIAFYQMVQERADYAEDACRVRTVNTAGTYSPIPYIFLAPAEWLGRKLHWSVEKRLYSMRFANYLGTTLLIMFAIGFFCQYRAPYVLLALSPLVFWLRASVSADGVTIAIVFLFLGYILRLTQVVVSIDKPQWWKILLLAALVGSCKPVYALICFSSVIAAVQPSMLNTMRQRIAFALLPGIVALSISLIWIKLADPALVYLGNGAQPTVQLVGILQDPTRFLCTVYRTINQEGWNFLYQLWVPYSWVPAASGAAIAALMSSVFLLLMISNPAQVSHRGKWLTLILSVGITLAIIVPLYMTYTPPGLERVLGLQGRYFIPAIALLVFAGAGIGRGAIALSQPVRDTLSAFLPLVVCMWLISRYLL